MCGSVGVKQPTSQHDSSSSSDPVRQWIKTVHSLWSKLLQQHQQQRLHPLVDTVLCAVARRIRSHALSSCVAVTLASLWLCRRSHHPAVHNQADQTRPHDATGSAHRSSLTNYHIPAMASAPSSIPLASPPLVTSASIASSTEGKPHKKRAKRRSQHSQHHTDTTQEGHTARTTHDEEAAAAAATAATETTAEKEGEEDAEGEIEATIEVAREGEGEGEAEHGYLPSSSSSTALLAHQPEGQPFLSNSAPAPPMHSASHSFAATSTSPSINHPHQLPPQLLTLKPHPPAALRLPPPSSSSLPLSSSASPAAVSAGAAASLPDGQVWTRLSHLQLLLDQQLISQLEYERRKQQLVDELTGTKLTPTVTPAASVVKRQHHTSAVSSSSSTSAAVSSSAPALRKRSHHIQQEREIDSIPLTSPSPTNSSTTSPATSIASSSPLTAVRHFPTHQSNNHLLMSSHSFLPRPPPDFSQIADEEAVLHTFDIDTSSWSRETVRVRVERESFARGSLRVAYHMSGLQEVEKRERKRVRAKEIEREKKRASKLRRQQPDSPLPSSSSSSSSDLIECTHHTYVAKMSIDPYEERESYFQDVITQHYARAYAIRYNSYGPPKKIDILLCWLLELKQRPGNPLCCVEVFVNGVYRKHNNNFGYVSEDERNTPQAFSHFSYEASQHSILIVDIQGVGDVWTDPQIHSRDGVGFGKGNMGERGVEKFSASHRCNAICRYLKLPNLGRERRGGRRHGAGTLDEMRKGGEVEGSAAGLVDDTGGEEEEGTMPAAQYMSYQSVDVMQIEIRGDQLDPFNADSPLPQHRRGMMASVSALILPPLIGGGKANRDGHSARGKVVERRDMHSPLILSRGKPGSANYGGSAAASALSEADTVSPRCRWCCIL